MFIPSKHNIHNNISIYTCNILYIRLNIKYIIILFYIFVYIYIYIYIYHILYVYYNIYTLI